MFCRHVLCTTQTTLWTGCLWLHVARCSPTRFPSAHQSTSPRLSYHPHSLLCDILHRPLHVSFSQTLAVTVPFDCTWRIVRWICWFCSWFFRLWVLFSIFTSCQSFLSISAEATCCYSLKCCSARFMTIWSIEGCWSIGEGLVKGVCCCHSKMRVRLCKGWCSLTPDANVNGCCFSSVWCVTTLTP